MSNKKLLEGEWGNKYFCKLALLDHIRECLQKDNYLKAIDEPKSSKKYEELDKELMDLKIILNLYFADNDNLYEERLKKFKNKMKK